MLNLKNKSAIVIKYREKLQTEFNTLKGHIEDTKTRMIDAPGAMLSHHDTSKVELGWLLDGMSRRIEGIKDASDGVDKAISASAFQANEGVVSVGSLVVVSNESSEMIYFLVPLGEGRAIEHEGKQILFLSPSAPLGRQLLGKEEGDTVILKGQQFEISQVV